MRNPKRSRRKKHTKRIYKRFGNTYKLFHISTKRESIAEKDEDFFYDYYEIVNRSSKNESKPVRPLRYGDWVEAGLIDND